MSRVLGPPPAGAQAPTPPAAPRVTIETGTLEGAVDSASGALVFRGVPYAAPPSGVLRWRAPQPAARWAGVRRADRPGHNCPQLRPYSDIDPYAAGTGEDCLNLNVWTPALGGPRRPVIVWIHGGGFQAGFGGEARHDGGVWARKGAVVVTLNYRLGAFGFLAHPALAAESPHGVSGNYGLLDQVAALQWVRRNIARFGGDPGRVTVAGESAGAMSVAALMASPLARGLYRGAILQSGTGIRVGTVPRAVAESAGGRWAAGLGVPGTGAAAAAALRALPADSLLAALRPPAAPPPLALVIDGWALPHPVDVAMSRGLVARVPAIVGSNADESDATFGAPARAFARLAAARGARVYQYQFTRAGEDSAARARGAFHSADITFAFGRPAPILEAAGRAAYDATLADAMSDYWVAFAASGNPNGPPAAGRWPRWPAYDPAADALLELGPTITVRQGVRRAVYDSLDTAARAKGELRPESRTAGRTAAGP